MPPTIRAILVLALIAAGCAAPSAPELAVLSGATMGTGYTVKLPHGGEQDTEKLQARIDARLEEINDLMSTWREDSELSRFNRSTKSDWFDVSEETALVMAEALRVAELSGGAFDVTVGPLVDLWKFGPEPGEFTLPAEEQLAEVRAAVGHANLEVRETPPSARKARPDLRVDLSAIAKGYGVDVLAELLERDGTRDYMVEIGGEVRTSGTKAGGEPWVVGIETPVADRRSVFKSLKVGAAAMATSGDYRNYHELDGKRYSHMIDARTGRPIEHRLASVSVVADDCMRADAFATALMVLGPDDGYDLATEQELAALFIVREESGFVERATPAFERLVGQGTR